MAEILTSLSTEERLRLFLREAASQPFEFGSWDCVLFLGNWLAVATPVDPAADVRGTYHSEPGWRQVVTREGGLLRFVHRRAARSGYYPRDPAAPHLGDIALLRAAADGSIVGAIRGKGRWWTKIGPGITGADVQALRAWGP